ncbi:hypothetical protein B0A49_04521 [Cryomyces minteri]|uniref:Autophagy-related protein 27 n=1 Tax=Cryomyces minteri TaxID=331657 RepID=A0A4U0X9P4_9PEZI|nr:hypothetical protein B0A49_04521 [Cryomyces minteri]
MRLPHDSLAIPAFLTLPSLISAISLDCSKILVDGQSFNLKALGGPHSVHWIRETPPSLSNTTFTIDICQPLKRTKDVPKSNECPGGTRVCGIESDYNLADGTHMVKEVIPIAGDYSTSAHRPLDPYYTRLKHSDANADADKEGLRIELNGGKFPFDGSGGVQQKAFVEFLCDPHKTGLEGDEGDGREKEDSTDEGGERRRKREEGEDGKVEDGGKEGEKEKDPDEGKSLRFVSYKPEGEHGVGTLRLEWHTKYACESQKDVDDSPPSGKSPSSSSHWGFFTWFLIIISAPHPKIHGSRLTPANNRSAFLATAAYLIFASWLNYNRYGARGWDLLPHGDALRDVPYMLRDWARRVASTVQGGRSRGGYAAV